MDKSSTYVPSTLKNLINYIDLAKRKSAAPDCNN